MVKKIAILPVEQSEKKTVDINEEPSNTEEERTVVFKIKSGDDLYRCVNAVLEEKGPEAAEAVFHHMQLAGAIVHNSSDPKWDVEENEELFRSDYNKFCRKEQLSGVKKAVIQAAKGFYLTGIFGLSAFGWYNDHAAAQQEQPKTDTQVAVSQGNFGENTSPFAPITFISAIGLVFAAKRFKSMTRELTYIGLMQPIKIAGQLEKFLEQKRAEKQNTKN